MVGLIGLRSSEPEVLQRVAADGLAPFLHEVPGLRDEQGRWALPNLGGQAPHHRLTENRIALANGQQALDRKSVV